MRVSVCITSWLLLCYWATRSLQVDVQQSTRWCLLDLCLYLIVKNEKKNGSVVGFVYEVNSLFALAWIFLVLMSDERMVCVCARAWSRNRSICLNVPSNTGSSDMLILQGRIGKTLDDLYWSSFPCTFCAVCLITSPLKCLWDAFLLVLSIRMGATINIPYLQIKQEWVLYFKMLESNLKKWRVNTC